MLSKEKSREIRVALRRVLMENWDPIGVRDEPCAQDEYDSYLGDLLALLLRSASGAEIEAYLLEVETGRMGLVDGEGNPFVRPGGLRKAVDAIQALRSLLGGA